MTTRWALAQHLRAAGGAAIPAVSGAEEAPRGHDAFVIGRILMDVIRVRCGDLCKRRDLRAIVGVHRRAHVTYGAVEKHGAAAAVRAYAVRCVALCPPRALATGARAGWRAAGLRRVSTELDI